MCSRLQPYVLEAATPCLRGCSRTCQASQRKRDGGRSFSLGAQWRWEHIPPHAHAASCLDLHVDCPAWLARGECDKNPGYMGTDCRRSCGRCPEQPPQPLTSPHEWVGQLSGGEACSGGVRRSLRVGFECAEEEALGRVDEPEPCGYRVSFATPAAC